MSVKLNVFTTTAIRHFWDKKRSEKPYVKPNKVLETKYSKVMVLNRRGAFRYRDLETISPGLRTLNKSKVYQKMHKNPVFNIKKGMKKIVTGTKDFKKHFTGTRKG